MKRGKLAIVAALIDTEPALQLADANEVVSMLRSTISAGRTDLVRLLLGRVSPAQWEKSGQGLLSTAAAARNTGMVRLLLERGAEPTPVLRFAVRLKAREVVRALAEHGANLNAVLPLEPQKVAATDVRIDPLGRQSPGNERLSRLADPPIFEAIHPLMDSKMVDLLLELGANPNVRDGGGRTPLMVAITVSQIYGKKDGAPWIERFVPQRLLPGQEDWEHSGVEPVRALLAKGADVALTDLAGLTALHHAARSDYNTEIARLLIAHGADVNARDKAGKPPLDHALGVGLVRMPKMLVAAGARRGAR